MSPKSTTVARGSFVCAMMRIRRFWWASRCMQRGNNRLRSNAVLTLKVIEKTLALHKKPEEWGTRKFKVKGRATRRLIRTRHAERKEETQQGNLEDSYAV